VLCRRCGVVDVQGSALWLVGGRDQTSYGKVWMGLRRMMRFLDE
jgi:hypothetical protein